MALSLHCGITAARDTAHPSFPAWFRFTTLTLPGSTFNPPIPDVGPLEI
jgi:hypothetical protein